MMKTALLSVEVNQRYPDVVASFPSQMGRRIGHNDLQRRANRSLEQMSAPGHAVREAQNNMDVKPCLAVVTDGDISDRAQHLALFGYFNLFVGLVVEVEPSD